MITNPVAGRIARLFWLAAAVLSTASCSDTAAPDSGNEPDTTTVVPTPTNPLDLFITVAPNVQLHLLDFGGTGEPVLLLTGLGNTANVFREFAPLLTDDFRVRALTRRGYGQSSKPSGGYDPATLANDIRVALDSLGISTVDLVGHSIAGEEMTRFAVTYGARLGKLVYLDAAYDRTDTTGADTPDWAIPPPPTASDVASRDAFGAYVTRTYGVTMAEAEIAASTVVATDGTVLGFTSPAWVNDSIISAVETPQYAGITAPALGIYAVPQAPADVAPWLTPGTPEWTEAEDWLANILLPAHEAQRAKFDTEVPNSTVLELEPAKHYVFLCCATDVANAVIAFLKAP